MNRTSLPVEFMKATNLIYILVFTLFSSCQEQKNQTESFTSNDYQDLVVLFKDWRTFENPPKEWFKEAYNFTPEDEWFDDVRKSSLRFA